MKVRAKFRVESKKEIWYTTSESGWDINLRPVAVGSAENKEFYKWTPGGSIVLETLSKNAADGFEVGGTYYVDFTRTE